MAAFASDAFTDVAGTTLGAHDANWNLVTSYVNSSKTNGSAVYITAFGNSAYYYSATPPSADYGVSTDVIIQSGTGPILGGPCGRVSAAAATFYHAQYNLSAGAWRLWKSVSGTFTQLGSDVSQSLTVGQAYSLKLEMIGTAIKLYVDGVLKISVTDSSISAAGFPGLRIGQSAGSVGGTTGLQLDNFSADPISAGTTVSPTVGHLTATGYAPTITRTGAQTISPTTGHVSLAGHAPFVTDQYATNVALATNGGTASASSELVAGNAAKANDGVIGASFTNAWLANSNPPGWWECDFNASYVLGRIIVYSIQDTPGNSNPSDSATGSDRVVSTYDVQAWDGSSWHTLESVSGDNHIKHTTDLTSAPYTTTKIRISVSAMVSVGFTGLDEVQAWGYPAAAGTIVSPSVTHAVFAGYVPTISRTANQSVAPTVAHAALAGHAPALTRTDNQSVAPTVAHAALAGHAPSVTQSITTTISPSVTHLAVAGHTPSVAQTANQSVAPSVAHAVLTGYAPSPAQSDHHLVAPSVAHAALAGHAPALTQAQSQTAAPDTAHAALAGYAPALAQTANQSIAPSVAHAALAGHAPTITQVVNQTVAPSETHAALAGHAPSVTRTLNQLLEPAAGRISLAGSAPTLAQPRSFAPTAGHILLAGHAPDILVSDARAAAPSTGHISLTGRAPSVSQSDLRVVAPSSGTILLTGGAPDVVRGQNQVVLPSSGAVELLGHVPKVVIFDPTAPVGPPALPEVRVFLAPSDARATQKLTDVTAYTVVTEIQARVPPESTDVADRNAFADQRV